MGRVLRFDSFSKILSSGMRLGFVSGPEPLLHALDMYVRISSQFINYSYVLIKYFTILQTATSNLQVPGLTQAVASTLLNSWGYDGFIEHTKNVSEFYRAKRDVFESALVRHLSGLIEWNTPEAGMFFWLVLKFFIRELCSNAVLV